MRTLLCFTLTGVLAGPAFAGNTPSLAPAPTPVAAPRAAVSPAEAAAARAEIDRLTDRIQELSRKLGPDDHVRVLRIQGPPGARELPSDPDALARIEAEFGKRGMEGMRDAPRDIRIERLEGGPSVGIGVVLSPNPAAPGVRLAAVTPDGPAAKAGLRGGDVLLSVDGKRVEGNDEDAMANARQLLHGLEKGRKLRLGYARAGKTAEATVVAGDIRRTMLLDGMPGAGAFAFGEGEMRMLAPEIDGELRRLLPLARCAPGEACEAPALFEAFRWQGLNLAAIDADLGRYFGARQGVLVLGGGFKGLRSGDVIQKVGDASVDSPKDVMRALRGRDVGTALPVLVLRDRKPQVVTVTVPEARALPFLPMAPMAPTPPTPPTPPKRPRPMAMPAPVAPPAPARPAALPPMPAPPAVPAYRARPAAAPTPPAPPTPPVDDDEASVDGNEVIDIEVVTVT